jgi:integrase/recombinase XerD
MQNLFKDLDDFTFNCKVRNLSDKTIRSYEQTLTLFILYLEREKYITKI